jgi:hypothetical protein
MLAEIEVSSEMMAYDQSVAEKKAKKKGLK